QKLLGRGGFGEVWQAKAPGGFEVALKCVSLQVHDGKHSGVTELRSLDIIKGIHHPNLLGIFGAWHIGEVLVIAMELAERSLWDRFSEVRDQGLRGIDREELLEYFEEAAKGIDHLNAYKHNIDGKEAVG